MVEILAQIAPLFEDEQAKTKSLGDHLGGLKREDLVLAGPGRTVLNWQFDQFRLDIKALRVVRFTRDGSAVNFLGTTFCRMTTKTFNLVRSFSFIGDPAYTLEGNASENQQSLAR